MKSIITLLLITFSLSAFSDKYSSETVLVDHPLKDYFTPEGYQVLKRFGRAHYCKDISIDMIKNDQTSFKVNRCWSQYENSSEAQEISGVSLSLEDFVSPSYVEKYINVSKEYDQWRKDIKSEMVEKHGLLKSTIPTMKYINSEIDKEYMKAFGRLYRK